VRKNVVKINFGLGIVHIKHSSFLYNIRHVQDCCLYFISVCHFADSRIQSYCILFTSCEWCQVCHWPDDV